MLMRSNFDYQLLLLIIQLNQNWQFLMDITYYLIKTKVI